ncbi:MAG TPA: Ig-like domain-containing protein [Longimicrobiaceae bacterium]|nr:Ig-like domain-containing protein [Longimicrobiaceae bacterium]
MKLRISHLVEAVMEALAIGSPSRSGIALGLALSLALLASCERVTDPIGGEQRGAPVDLTVQASLGTTTTVNQLTVEVTAADIAVPILSNLALADTDVDGEFDRAEGSITVPAGRDRTFTARAFDREGFVTHEGLVTENVRPNDKTVRIPLYPKAVGVPIEVVVSTYSVTISPTSVSLATASRQPFIASVTDAGGAVIEGPALTWGSSNPAIASVDSTGLATAAHSGSARIVVSYRGIAAEALVTVDGGTANQAPLAANDSAATEAGVAIDIPVLVNDSDPDGDLLSVEGVSDPAGGVAVIGAGDTINYTPDAGFTGEDMFEYTVVDARGGIATGSVTVAVSAPLDCTEVVTLGEGATMRGRMPGVEITGNVTVSAATTVCGDLIVSNASLNLSGQTVEVEGDFEVTYDGWLIMQDANDKLTVSGNVRINGRNSATGLLTAGVIETRGNFNVGDAPYTGNQAAFRPSGSHRIVLNGTVPQQLRLPCGYTNCGVNPASIRSYNHIEIANPAGVELRGGAVDITGNVTITDGIVSGGSWTHLYGDLIDVAGGRWKADQTILMGTDQLLPSRMSGRLQVGRPSSAAPTTLALSGDLELTGNLEVAGSTSALTLNGHTLRVHGDLKTSRDGRIVMNDDADLLAVTGNALFETFTDSHAGALFSAGTFELSGNMTVGYNHFRASGTHLTVFAGTAAQRVELDCYYTNCGPYNPTAFKNFQSIQVSNPVGVSFTGKNAGIAGSLSVLEGAAARFVQNAHVHGSLDLAGTLTVDAGRTLGVTKVLYLRSTSTLNNNGTMPVGGCSREAGYTITGTDPCP